MAIPQHALGGFTFLRDAVWQGYPFVEAISQVLPICDSFTITVYPSMDSTLYWARRMEKESHKIRVVVKDWPDGRHDTNAHGRTIGIAQDWAMDETDGHFALLVQADEIWPDRLVEYFGDLFARYKDSYQSFSFPFLHVHDNFQRCYDDPAYIRAVRCVRRGAGIHSCGDGWTFIGGDVRPQYHCITPAPILHCVGEHPVNILRKRALHGSLYPDMMDYQKDSEEARRLMETVGAMQGDVYDEVQSPYPLPESVKGLLGVKEYYVREGLFRDLDRPRSRAVEPLFP